VHPAYETLNIDGDADIILICEHASNHIPEEYENLGLTEDDLQRHIAWDIGMAEITRQISQQLEIPAILARFSRLLIDGNREHDHPTLIPTQSDNIPIPGNQNLSEADITKRRDAFYHPFHNAASELLQSALTKGHTPLVIGMHSYTPIMNDTPRPWHAGLLWDKDPRLAKAFIESLSDKGLHVGDNEPYSGRELFHTMKEHGARHGLPHVTLEVRQDLINHAEGVENWSQILVSALQDFKDHPDLQDIKHF